MTRRATVGRAVPANGPASAPPNAAQTPSGAVSPPPAPSQAPAPEQSGIAALIRSLLPARAAEDAMAGRVIVTLGTKTFTLPVLPLDAEEQWTKLFNERLMTVMASLERPDTSPAVVIAFLQGMPAIQLELLRAYDLSGVLPDDAWIRKSATGPQLLQAVLGVTAAAFPLLTVGIQMVLSSPDVGAELLRGMRGYTSSLQPSTAGRRATPGVS